LIDPHKRTLIFDFGNVLFNLDFDHCFSAFENLIGFRWNFKTMPESVLNAIRQYERGQLSDEEFIWVFQQYNSEAHPRAFIDAWNSMLDDLPVKRLIMLEKLKKTYNLALLSNINNFHLIWIRHYLKTNFEIDDFENKYFDQVFYSHIIGMRKPDEEIYKYVTDTMGLVPASTLFIDDLENNIIQAKLHGWQAVIHDPTKEITELLPEYIQAAWN